MCVPDADLSLTKIPRNICETGYLCNSLDPQPKKEDLKDKGSCGFIGYYPYSVACQLCASAVETHLRWAPARARKGPKDTSASCRMILFCNHVRALYIMDRSSRDPGSLIISGSRGTLGALPLYSVGSDPQECGHAIWFYFQNYLNVDDFLKSQCIFDHWPKGPRLKK